MPAIRRRHDTLGQLFVYYERLDTDNDGINRPLYLAAKNAFSAVSTEIGDIIQTASVIRKIGEAERQKEENLLNTIFNANVNVDLDDKDSVKEFISTLNACIGLKEVYERNVFLVQNSKGQKSVISFFPTYFMMIWDERVPAIEETINSAIEHMNPGENILDIIQQILEPALESIVPAAIERMFHARPELRNQMPPEMQDAYSSLLNMIGTVQQQGSLANQLSNIYKLDDIKQFLTNEIANKNQFSYKGLDGLVKKNFHQRGGLSLEAIENTVLKTVANGLKNTNPNMKVEVYATGASEVKADNILTIGIDPELMAETLETNLAISRKRNTDMFKKLGNDLKNIKNGYIIYSSDKNYTYNEGFKSRGGFQGDKISLDSYRQIMNYTNRNARTFVGTILQTAKGAVGDPSLQDTMEQALAQDIAYFLFDDFKTIGDETKAGDTKSIHIMNLNGILIPLSFFLILFARAIEEEIGNPEDFVKVNLSIPEILFPTQEEQSEWQEQNGASSFDAWVYQREYALAQSKIEVHFLKEFKEIISEYL